MIVVNHWPGQRQCRILADGICDASSRHTGSYERSAFEAHHVTFAGLYFDLNGDGTRDAGIRTTNVTRQS